MQDGVWFYYGKILTQDKVWSLILLINKLTIV